MEHHIDVRKRQLEDWLKREGEYSEINHIIKPLLEKMDDDALSDAQWEALNEKVEHLNDHAKRVSEIKQELARTIAGYPTR